MDRIERITRSRLFPNLSRATNHQRGRTSELRPDWLEGRLMLSGSPSIHVMNLTHVADIGTPGASIAAISTIGSLEGTFVASGIVTIGGPLLPGNPAQAGGAIWSGGGPVNGSDSASSSNSATGSGAAGTVASNSASSAGGAVSTSPSPATNPAGNATSAASNATNTPGNATTTANPGTTTNTASGSSSGSTAGGIPVVTGQLTLVYGTLATNSATIGGLTTAPAPVPAFMDRFAGEFRTPPRCRGRQVFRQHFDRVPNTRYPEYAGNQPHRDSRCSLR